MSKIPLLVIVLVVLVAVIGFGAPQVMAQFSGAPAQPIGFTHTTHVEKVGLDCTFCHRNVARGENASIPAEGQCMFCHRVVNKDNPNVQPDKGQEIQKLIDKFNGNEPINWVRVHRVPDHVRFVHEAHVNFFLKPGVSVVQVCATCHGEVAKMGTAQQVRSLGMGDCLNCHRVNNAPTDCTTCHK